MVDPGPDPSAAVDGRDLLDAVNDRLSEQERELAVQWASGEPWDKIGEKTGDRPDALRARLGRALERVRKDFLRCD